MKSYSSVRASSFRLTRGQVLAVGFAVVMLLWLILKVTVLRAEGCKSYFADLPSKHPSCQAVASLVQAGVLNGYADGTLRPSLPMTRAEAITLLVKARQGANATPGSGTAAGNHWATDYFEAAKAARMVIGDEFGFRLNDPITRAELVALAARAMNLIPNGPGPVPYVDVVSSDWYHGYVSVLTGPVMGPKAPERFQVYSEDRFDGERQATREEAFRLAAFVVVQQTRR